LSEMLLLLWEVAVLFEVAEYNRHLNVNEVSSWIRSCIWHACLFQAEWLGGPFTQWCYLIWKTFVY